MTCGCTGIARPTLRSTIANGDSDIELVDLAERIARDDDDAAVAHGKSLAVAFEVFADVLAGRNLHALVDDAAMQACTAADVDVGEQDALRHERVRVDAAL